MMGHPQKSSLLSPKLAKQFKDYASYHQTAGNKLTHYLGIPMIVTSLLGLLSQIPIHFGNSLAVGYFRLDGGTLLIIFALVWYFLMDWKITLPFSLTLGGLYFLGRAIPIPMNWILFIGGWILQGVGHATYEKKSPAFFKNFYHLLVGPLWIFARIVGYK